MHALAKRKREGVWEDDIDDVDNKNVMNSIKCSLTVNQFEGGKWQRIN